MDAIAELRGNRGDETNVEGSDEFFCPGIPRGKRVPLSPFLRKTRRKQIVSGRYERPAIRSKPDSVFGGPAIRFKARNSRKRI